MFEGILDKYEEEEWGNGDATHFGFGRESGVDAQAVFGKALSHDVEVVAQECDFVGKRNERARTIVEHVSHKSRHVEHHVLRFVGVDFYHAVNIVEHIHVEVRVDLRFEIGEAAFGRCLHEAFALKLVVEALEHESACKVASDDEQSVCEVEKERHGEERRDVARVGYWVVLEGPGRCCNFVHEAEILTEPCEEYDCCGGDEVEGEFIAEEESRNEDEVVDEEEDEKWQDGGGNGCDDLQVEQRLRELCTATHGCEEIKPDGNEP